MDTSDDNSSHLDHATDVEWGHTRERRRRQSRKRNSKTDVEKAVDLGHPISIISTESVCCSCSKKSSCKTGRCECRAASGMCSSSCGCEPSKCSNREEEATMKDMLQLSVHMSMSEEEVGNSHDLASHGAMLLQTALSEKNVNQNADGSTVRKPLSDIGNNLVSLIHGLHII